MVNSNNWIVRPNPKHNAKLRLFCFPYAGSSAVVTYRHFVDNLPDFIEVCPVELPGRGARMAEDLIDDLEQVVEEISFALKDFLDIPFAFFGHSMGALISYELSHKVFGQHKVKPSNIYVSAHKAPFTERDGLIMHKLDSNEFTSELMKMDGVSKEIMEHKELMELMLPIIKNDYAVCETYDYKQKEVLDIPITIFGGVNDKDITEANLLQWEKLTSSNFRHFMIEGDHFFLTKEKNSFTRLFSDLLTSDFRQNGN
ncbi:MAG: thioesterase [Ignavibacteriae bacterium]|nr:thioesterase [Ignavibacteriota bacterium]